MKRMQAIILVWMGTFLTSVGFAADLMHCQKVSTKEIQGLFDRWAAALRTNSPEKVDENYMSTAVLLPTISRPRFTSAERINYFTHFLTEYPRIVAKIDSSTVILGCNSAVDTGLYSFFTKDGEVIHARYTFTYKWNGSRWLISSHHSSAVPDDD